MSYVQMFLPWIVYAVFPSDDWQWGALAALVVTVAVIARHRRAGRAADAMIMEIGTACFFAALTALAFPDPNSALHPYGAAIANGALTLIAGISLAIRHPFTAGIARETTPREYWHLPQFLRVNMVITSIWTVAFAASAIALAFIAGAGDSNSAASVIVQIAGIVVPLVCTVRYVARVQARVQARVSANEQG
jgi:hypothetical protein